jgi:hypothetical protein
MFAVIFTEAGAGVGVGAGLGAFGAMAEKPSATSFKSHPPDIRFD